MTSFVARRPRTAAALCFGAAAIGVAGLWFLPSALARRDATAFLLFVAAPGAAAAAAGALGGASLRDRTRTRRPRQAVFRGIGIATLALALFAPLFTALHWWTAQGDVRPAGLAAAVFSFGLLAAWVPAAAIGAGLGLLLFRLDGKNARSGRTPADPEGRNDFRPGSAA